MEGSFSSESITYKSFPRLGHLVLHVDEVQVVVDAAAKVAVLGAYYLQIRTSVWAPSPACRRSPGGGGRRCQGSFSSESITYKSFPRLGHLVLHVDEVQVVVDAAAKVAPTNHYLGLGT